MAKIIIRPKNCQIIEEYDYEFLRALDSELSFPIQGAEYSPAYGAGKWDGRKYLLSTDLKFNHGLLRRTQKFFADHNKEYTVEDYSDKKSKSYPLDIITKLNELNKAPYPYQLEAVETALNYDRAIIKIATGGGKSLVLALLTAALNKPTIIYVVGKDLLYQLHKFFSAVFEEDIGIIGDGKCDIKRINIATVWTVGQALGVKTKRKKDDEDDKEIKIPPEKYKEIRRTIFESKVNMYDECHLCAADTIQNIFQLTNPEYTYGLTATIKRDDGADLLIENFLGNVVVDISAKELISGDFLVAPLIKFLSVPKYPHPYTKKKYPTIYQEYITENEARNEMVAKGAVKLVEQGFQVLVLFHSIAHGDILYELISKQISCALLSGEDNSKERSKVKEELESGKLRCIIASKIFDIGIDLPSLSALIVAGGGKSSIRALQRIGRVIRKYPGKSNVAVLDFVDQAPFLLSHSEIRKNVYKREFDVIWPAEKK